MNELAIIIPAYKGIYFEKALSSIANQTNKRFTLYIGDDCSPYDLRSVVEKYSSQIRIVYKRFEENLGSGNLVGQWERCIDMAGDEEWIWLFSDDDEMDANCVEQFYSTLQLNPDHDLYHFNVIRIDSAGNHIDSLYTFPAIMRSEEFIIEKMKNGYFSTVVEFIFRKSCFLSLDRFQNFDLAWCSDDATWIKMGKRAGIRNIENAMVHWRTSPFNISANQHDREILKRKYNSQIEFSEWIYLKTKSGEYKIDIGILQSKIEKWYLESIKSNIFYLPFNHLVRLNRDFYTAIEKNGLITYRTIHICLYKVYGSLKTVIKKSLSLNS
jgi:glycosyltransferase involved in cell wall biosynthesis